MMPAACLTSRVDTRGYWDTFHERWSQLAPPQRPAATVCAAVDELIAPHRERTLLLGVTPELAGVASTTIAVDWSGGMLGGVWPGNSHTQRAVRADWRHMPCAARSFSSALGDGSLNCLEYPHGYQRAFAELARVIRPGGRVVMRVYLTPEPCESVAGVRGRTMAGRVTSMHALKWRLAMALCAARANANVAVYTIADAFDREFPVRRILEYATGWTAEEIAQVDAYRGRTDVYSFPTAAQVLAVVPREFERVRFVPTRGYELAERCPLLVMEARS